MTDKLDMVRLGPLKHSLEPIVELDAGNILSFEVSSFPANRRGGELVEAGGAEPYPLTSLLARQLEFFQKLNQHDPQLYRALFIKVEPRLFQHGVSWQDFIPFIFQFRVGIGCDMASVRDGMSASALHRLRQLRELGVKLWLNNADETLSKIPDDILHTFSGIKIDKRCFWQCFNRNDAAFIERATSIWGNNSVIVEGVENRHHLSFVREQGLTKGQGFHWRAKLARHASWH